MTTDQLIGAYHEAQQRLQETSHRVYALRGMVSEAEAQQRQAQARVDALKREIDAAALRQEAA